MAAQEPIKAKPPKGVRNPMNLPVVIPSISFRERIHSDPENKANTT